MAQQFRTLAALVVDLVLFPAPTGQLTAVPCTHSVGLRPPSGFCGHCMHIVTDVYRGKTCKENQSLR